MEWTCACGVSNPGEAKFCNQCGAPKPEPQPAPPEPAQPAPPDPAPPVHAAVPPPVHAATPAKKGGGWVKWVLLLLALLLIFCFIAMAVGGVVYWKVKKSGKAKLEQVRDGALQQAAVLQMEEVSSALSSYKERNGAYPNPGHNPDTYYSLVDLEQIRADLVPDFLGELPKDPWGNEYEYGSSQDNQSYVLICRGSDGEDKLQKIPDATVETHCFEDEIVLEDGSFVQRPAGDQQSCAGEAK
jgi:hypothetical protein